MKKDALIDAVVESIKEDIFLNHKKLAYDKHSQLKNYLINPNHKFIKFNNKLF